AFIQISRIFSQLTPAVAKDLPWKAERGCAELSFTTQRAAILGEAEAIAEASRPYLQDEDVQSLAVLDAADQPLCLYPPAAKDRIAHLFTGEQGRAHENADSFVTWQLIDNEGAAVGKVALEVSKRRLKAGALLRHKILTGVAGGCLVALMASCFFVSFYIAPLTRVMERTFVALEQRTREALE